MTIDEDRSLDEVVEEIHDQVKQIIRLELDRMPINTDTLVKLELFRQPDGIRLIITLKHGVEPEFADEYTNAGG